MYYHFIYWIVIIILAFAVSQYRKKAEVQKERTKVWKEAYDEAKGAWANQSNSVREKGIECDQLEKENKKLEKDYDDVCEQLGRLGHLVK